MADSDDKEVTIVVVPRERFSYARRSLDSLLADRSTPFDLVVVDAGGPRDLARDLERRAARDGFEVLRVNRYLPPNVARNLGFARARTKYVVFVDNDVIVEPGWLGKLLACAKETGAAVVGPLTLIGEDGVVHMAGGLCHIDERDGRRSLRQGHRFMNRPLAEVRGELARAPTEMVELHCCLVDSAFLRELGGLDEGLLCSREHLDLCLSARARGREVWLEPSSIIAYVPPPPFAPSDVPFFLVRWSDAWGLPTIAHFRAKWRLDKDDDEETLTWLKKRRYRVLDPWFSRSLAAAFRVFGKDRVKRFARKFVFPIEGLVNRAAVRPPRRDDDG